MKLNRKKKRAQKARAQKNPEFTLHTNGRMAKTWDPGIQKEKKKKRREGNP